MDGTTQIFIILAGLSMVTLAVCGVLVTRALLRTSREIRRTSRQVRRLRPQTTRTLRKLERRLDELQEPVQSLGRLADEAESTAHEAIDVARDTLEEVKSRVATLQDLGDHLGALYHGARIGWRALERHWSETSDNGAPNHEVYETSAGS